MTIIERARKYVESCPPAISGTHGGGGGHAATFRVACALVHGFALNDVDAMTVMMEFNQRCLPKWTERDLRHKLNSAARAVHTKPRGWMLEERGVDGSAPVWIPPPKKEKIVFNGELLKKVQRAEWTCDHAWLRARSACDPWALDTGAFIDGLYAREDRVMIFTSMRSVGDFMRWRGQWFELGKQPGLKARRVPKGPSGSREGCVMLIQPVDGIWHNVEGASPPRLSRRTRSSVTAYRYMLWESDAAPESLWLNALAQVRLPIVAITSSAGRSLHALVRVDALNYDEWSQMRQGARDFMTQLGFDPQALSNPTAAMRLPNSMREGKMKEGPMVPFEHGPRKQRLLYYNPEAAHGECIGERPCVAWGTMGQSDNETGRQSEAG